MLPNKLRRIGNLAFERIEPRIKSIILPNTLEFVGANAFIANSIDYLKIENAFSVPRNYNQNRISPVFAESRISCIEIIGNISDEWLNFVFDDTGFKNFYVYQSRRAGIYLHNGMIWTVGTRQDVNRLLAVNTDQSQQTVAEHSCSGCGTTRCTKFQAEYDEAVRAYDQHMKALPPGLVLPDGRTVREAYGNR